MQGGWTKTTHALLHWQRYKHCCQLGENHRLRLHLATRHQNPPHCCQSGEIHRLRLHLAPLHQNLPWDEEMNYEFVLLHPPSLIIESVPYKFGI